MSKVILITGCSTGIGCDLAVQLANSGYTVVATARKVETMDDLKVALKLPLDVTRPDSIQQVVEQTIQRFGRIDILVNNAGYSIRGAIEEVPVDEARQMFDANVFGVMHMIQAVVPHMRQQKAGRIINVSSISGKLVTPTNGTYSASKFALEGLSDALRLELVPFGIQVVLVEPGSIKTQFHATVETNAREIFSNRGSPYQPLYRQSEQVSAGMRRKEPGPEAVSKVIQQAIEADKPKDRYLVAFPLSGRMILYLGDSAWNFVVKQMFKIPRVVDSN